MVGKTLPALTLSLWSSNVKLGLYCADITRDLLPWDLAHGVLPSSTSVLVTPFLIPPLSTFFHN